MTAPRSLDEARRDGWDEEAVEIVIDKDFNNGEAWPHGKPKDHRESPVEAVSEKLRAGYRSVA